MEQIHHGTGDNIGRDKIIQKGFSEQFIRELTADKDLQIKELRRSISLIEKNYTIQLEERDQQIKDKNQELEQAIKDKEFVKKQLQTLSEKASKADFSEMNELYKTALTVFISEKNIEKALNILDEAILEQQENSTRKKEMEFQKEIQKEKDQQSENRILKAELLTAEYKFEEAEQQYKIAYQTKVSAKVCYSYANLLYILNRFDEGIEYFKKALDIYTSQDDEVNMAFMLNNLGLCFDEKEEAASALNYYIEAKEIYEKLIATNSEIYLPDLADTYFNLGLFFYKRSLYYKKKEFDWALKYYKAAIEIYEIFSTTNPEKYQVNLAKAYNGLGVLMYNKDLDSALEYYKKAVEIQEKLIVTNYETYLPDLAMTLSNLASLYSNIDITESLRSCLS